MASGNPTESVLPIVDRLRRYEQSEVDAAISIHDDMFQAHRREHYFAVGRDAVRIIALAMMKAGVTRFETVLDLPCGSGRVLRHLVRFLPDSRVIASDLDPNHVHFCAERFHAVGLLSSVDLDEVVPDRPIDLLWCGSLLTHFGADRLQLAMSRMVNWLAPGGIAIFTLHGRWSVCRQTTTPYRYMSDEAFERVANDVATDGFGYREYAVGEDRLAEGGYGFSVSLPSWILRIVEGMADVRLLDYSERGWDNHQDVLILRKIPLASRPWMFEEA